MKTDKILSYIGFAAVSRNAVTGTELVLSEIRRKRNGLCIVIASDASERTKKQITDKCDFYGVPLVAIESDMYELGKMAGKKHPAAAVAVTDKSLAAEILKCSE